MVLGDWQFPPLDGRREKANGLVRRSARAFRILAFEASEASALCGKKADDDVIDADFTESK